MSLVLTYQPTSGWTIPIYPVYNDQTHQFTSSAYTINNYKSYFDVNINDEYINTLVGYPFDGIIQTNPQFSKNYLEHDFNYNTILTDNPDALKKISITPNESYARQLYYSACTSAASTLHVYLVLNSTSTNTGLRVNDRIYIIPDSTTVNTHYNTYAKVTAVSNNLITTDLYWSAATIQETGTFKIGVEYFDYGYVGGTPGITTTNTHNLLSGNNIFLQMDTSAVAIFQMSGTTGSLTNLYCDVLDILSAPVPFNTDIPTTLDDIAANINANETIPQYTAYHYSGDPLNRLFIYSRRELGDATVGFSLFYYATGDLTFRWSDFTKTSQFEPITDTGINYNYTNSYVLEEVLNPNSFTVGSFTPGYDCPNGSQRGSIICSDNIYITGSSAYTYYIMNSCNLYDYANYKNEISGKTVTETFNGWLTNQPLDECIKFYSVNDLNTFDTIWDSSGNYLSGGQFHISIDYSGGSTEGWNIKLTGGTTGYGFDIVSGNTYHRLSYGFGAWNLNKIPLNLITATQFPYNNPTTPIIGENVLGYRIKSSLTADTEICFVRDCTPWTYYQIIFLNRWGSFDYVSVTANHQTRTNFERALFNKKRERTYSASDYGVQPKNRGNTVFNINSSEKIKLYSDFLTLDQINWLEEIQGSPEVYLYLPHLSNPDNIELNVLFPVNGIDAEIVSYNEKSGLKRLELNVEVSNDKIHQGN